MKLVLSKNNQRWTDILLQIARQTKRSFKTAEAARSAALEIKTRFPALQVSIYDGSSKSRTVVGLPGSVS